MIFREKKLVIANRMLRVLMYWKEGLGKFFEKGIVGFLIFFAPSMFVLVLLNTDVKKKFGHVLSAWINFELFISFLTYFSKLEPYLRFLFLTVVAFSACICNNSVIG